MNASDRRTLLVLGASAAGPILAMVVIRFGLGVSGPASASAMPLAHAGETLPSFEPEPLTDQQLLTRSFIDDYDLPAQAPTPFLEPSVRVMQDDQSMPIEPEPIDTTVPPPHVQLSSIFGSSARPIAVIDSRMLRIGDELPEGWIIQAIDTEALTVTLTHPHAKTPHVLSMESPGGG